MIVDWDNLVKEDRVHQSVYTDPTIFNEEIVKIFGQNWVYLAHESEIPNPNDFKTGYLGKRPIIITRDRNGEIHSFLNRCMHRGATICRQEKGSAKQFTCPYHGWAYSNNGDLAGVPWPKGYGPDFDKSEFDLKEVRVESYKGFIFGTLNQEASDLIDYLGNARPLLDQWIEHNGSPDQLIVRNNAHRMILNGNWKFVYDNAGDGYHVAFSHRSLLAIDQRYEQGTDNADKGKDMVYFKNGPDEGDMYVQYLGNGHIFLDQRPAYGNRKPGDLWKQQRPQPGREYFEEKLIKEHGEEKAYQYLDRAVGAQMNLSIFPNLLIIGNQIQVIEPIAVDKTQISWYATTVGDLPDEINQLRMRSQEDFPAFGEPDDVTNFAECHRGVSIPEVEWVMLNRGFDLPNQWNVDEKGIITAPVTDELTMRGYFQEWKKRLSTSRKELKV